MIHRTSRSEPIHNWIAMAIRVALLLLLLALNTLDAADNSEDSSVAEAPDSWPGWYEYVVQRVSEAILSTIKNTLYRYMNNITSGFAEKVRSVFHDEIYELLDSMWKLIVKALSYPDFIGTLLGKLPKDVANKIMAIGLIFICLILNYIFWQLHLSVLFALAFNGSILLMYKAWGPVWIYSNIWHLMSHTWILVSFVWDHPYISSFVIIAFYILGLIIPIVRCLIIPIRSWLAHRGRKQKLDTIDMRLSRLEEMLTDAVQSVQLSIALLVEEVQLLKTTVHSHTCTLANEMQGIRATVDEVHLNTGSTAALTGEVKQMKSTVNDIHLSNGSIATLADDVQELKATMKMVHLSSGSISSLKDEVVQLKATVNEVHSSTEGIVTITDEVQQLKVTVNEIHSNNGSIATLIDEIQQLKIKLSEMNSINATAMPVQRIPASTANQVPLHDVSPSYSCNTGQPSPRQCSRDGTPVNGERIIWGTYSNTIEKKVEETIAKLTSVSASDFTITKKFPDCVSKKWWFVISAEESVLLKLQEEWHLVKAQTHWKLKKVPTDQASSSV